jgi:hypothetical protein
MHCTEHPENATEPVKPVPKTSYSRKFVAKMKESSAAKHLTNKTIMEAADISRSTFYRIIDNEIEYPVITLDDAINISIFLDLSLDSLYRPAKEIPASNLPVLDGPRDNILENTTRMLAERKEMIDALQAENSSMKLGLSTKDDRINALSAELNALHNLIHELNRQHTERIDRLHAELSRRNQQLLDLLQK